MELEEKEAQLNEVSLNTLSSAIHAFAIFNYRSQPFISYFISIFELLTNSKKLRAKLESNSSDESAAKQLIHYDRQNQ
jgi:hypothetical protein